MEIVLRSKGLAFLLLALGAIVLVACAGSDSSELMVEPAPDRPTFVWIFSDP